jgi:Tfp pilus assembly protein PilF
MDNADSILRQAEHCRDRKQWNEADRLYRVAVATHDTIATRIAYGTYLADRQDYGGAIVHFTAGLEQAQRRGDLAAQAVVFHNLAAIYREVGDADLAQRFQRQSLAIEDSAGAAELLAWSQDALLSGRLSLAERLAQSALEIAEADADAGGVADSWGGLGVIAARKGNLRLSARMLIRAIRGHRDLGDEGGLGIDYQNLAEVCGLMGRFAWQREFFRAAGTFYDRTQMWASCKRVQVRLHELNRLAMYRDMDVRWN